MATIKAPFNFVPLSDQVFFPDWADKISHDIPFEDGVSGTIELKITAQTPIFVRNGHTKEDADANNGHGNEVYNSFSHIDKRYFIPGTSIKGSLRNVLEIMSFGKMRLDKAAKFAQREWDNPQLYPLKAEQQQFHCGWLRQDGNGYRIVDCGKPYRIAMDKIDKHIGSKIMFDHFSKSSSLDLNKTQSINNKDYDPKTAVFKYELLRNYKLHELCFSQDADYCNNYKNNRVKVDSKGDITGTIVLTGQPDKYLYPRPTTLSKGAGKFYEFVFPTPNGNAYDLSEEEFNHYKFIYSDSPDWAFALKKLQTSQGIPVFFRVKNKAIKDFGLAFLYKLPYDKTPFETLNFEHQKESPDLADCIFGYTTSNNSLKGRVIFSNAFSTKGSPYEKDIPLTLSSPKASYYPIYIQQNGNNGKVNKYRTYNDGKISGWKRYVVRKNVIERSSNNDKIDTSILPLNSGSEFKCFVRFHNLKKTELGALLSAITFHNSPNCYHQIGQGKPYGFGKVSINIEKFVTDFENNDTISYMTEFEATMQNSTKKRWVDDSRIVNLFTLAHEEITYNDVFDYMEMSTDGSNEFQEAKRVNEYLKTFTELSGKKYSPNSLYAEFLKAQQIELEKAIEQKKLQEERDAQEAAKKKAEEEQAAREARLDAGFKFLNEKRADFAGLKITSLADGIKRCKQFLDKNKGYKITDSDIDAIHQWLLQIPRPTKKGDLNLYTDPNSKPWKDLAQMLDKTTAQQWFNELNK